MSGRISFAWIAALAWFVTSSAVKANEPFRQTIFMHRAPGVYDQNRPETITDALFDEPVQTVNAAAGTRRRLGLSFTLSYLNGPPDKIAESLSRLLELSEQHNIPVLVVLDGQNWWNYRADLWNWWDPNQPGFDPANSANVEWTDWAPEHAVKISWRNWGRQIRVRPMPNLASPQYRAACALELTRLVGIVRSWADRLPPEKRSLFPGVKVGWEASVGINAYHYPDGNKIFEAHPTDAQFDPVHGLDMQKDFAGGLAPLGYAALTAAGWKHPGPVTLADQERITADYLAFLARTCRKAGLPAAKIIMHAGGQYAPWEKHYSFGVAINRDSVPGWSLYGTFPEQAGDLKASLEHSHRAEWAAAEWLPNAQTAAQWADAYDRTLNFERCRFISVYNWESIRRNPEALDGLRRALKAAPNSKSH